MHLTSCKSYLPINVKASRKRKQIEKMPLEILCFDYSKIVSVELVLYVVCECELNGFRSL